MLSQLKSVELKSSEESSERESMKSPLKNSAIQSKGLSLPPISSASKIKVDNEGMSLEELTKSYGSYDGRRNKSKIKTMDNPIKQINRNDYFGKRSKSYRKKES